ncbi:hypothetical protein GCM10010168_70590 [Actinoplanes ianthinogenes]|uniref:Uncharacterized protein n=1 Tax=Actinoplanes ianthinogenes TaxID=122358 RepID=A0ABM7M6R9_9ACTN|nr:hypothetical protein [Actinoplanes ianthinogenes]BCJ47351.1 hypothetical protein Aiant_80080 [Actinoplanes ianthinogenes]GGR41859.1 hypothetical protein GCM10010168_70590 [Actinoplanes ianthinogenes]
MRWWGRFLLIGGAGALAGSVFGEPAAAPALVAVAAGLILFLLGGRSGARDLVGDATAQAAAGRDATAQAAAGRDATAQAAAGRDATAQAAAGRDARRRATSAVIPERPSFQHLGPQVEKILSLAEEQAADIIAEAKSAAAQIVAQAHTEAKPD